MKLHDLKPKVPKKARKRLGQGNATGQGTYGGRGGDGQNSRAGGGVRPGFEGGQSGLLDRLPKLPGFKNPNRVEAQEVATAIIDANYTDGEIVNFASLLEKGLVRARNAKVKVLLKGDITKKVTVEGLLISKGAQAAIEKAGGKVA
jgi:large subunit ribosomal protein L15